MAYNENLMSKKCLLRLLLIPETPKPCQKRTELESETATESGTPSVVPGNTPVIPVLEKERDSSRTAEDKGFLLKQLLLADTSLSQVQKEAERKRHAQLSCEPDKTCKLTVEKEPTAANNTPVKTEPSHSTALNSPAGTGGEELHSDVDDEHRLEYVLQSGELCQSVDRSDVTEIKSETALTETISYEAASTVCITRHVQKPVHKLNAVCNKSIMKNPRQTDASDMLYVCRQCGAGFNHLGSFKRHMHSHTGEKPFICRECGAGFIQGSDLRTHMRTHTGDKPHVCKQCGAAFTRSGNLKRHMQTHTGVRPFECEQCGSTFTTAGNLKTHMQTHTGKRPYLCKQCGCAYMTFSHLKVHIRTHTGDRPYVCSECGSTFVTSSDLKKHTRTHTGDRPYVCQQCGSGFTRNCHLKRHSQICLPVRF